MLSVLSNANAEELITSQDQEEINASYAWCEENGEACKSQCRKVAEVSFVIRIAAEINKDKE